MYSRRSVRTAARRSRSPPGFRGEVAFNGGVAEDQALDTVLPRLSPERAEELANECIQLYMWDRLGCDN